MHAPGTPSVDQLLVLLTVVEAGSFTAAAKRLRRATSAVSYAIDAHASRSSRARAKIVSDAVSVQPGGDTGASKQLALDEGDFHAGSGQTPQWRPRRTRSNYYRVEGLDHAAELTIQAAAPMAHASSRSAMGRSHPPIALTNLTRSS